MSKYIELIDKYRVEQSPLDTDYNPPSYIWTDNTGEIVRCENCINWKPFFNQNYCGVGIIPCPFPDDYCSKGEKKKDANKG